MQLAGSIPAGTYWAEVDSDTPLVGLLSTVIGPIATNRDHEMQGALDVSSPWLALPRVLKNVAGVGGPRSSTLFAANTGSAPGNITLRFVDASGAVKATSTHTAVPPQGFVTLDVRTLDALPDGSYAVVADAIQPFALSENTAFHTPANTVAAAYSGLDHHGGLVYVVSLPRIATTDDTLTPFNIQNLTDSSATLVVEYTDHSGTSISTTNHSLAPNGFTRIDPTAALPANFEGSALVMADQPLAIRVDELWTLPCDPPSDLQIQTTPPSPVDVGTIMTFTATAAGTRPLTYSWDFDDGRAATGPTVTHTFPAPGTYSVTLTVSNLCGLDSTSRAIEILPVYAHRVFLPLVVR
jgi:hypothetical protein